jgi:hypothetical protein
MDSPLVQDRNDFLYFHLLFHADNLQQGAEYVQVNSSCRFVVISLSTPRVEFRCGLREMLEEFYNDAAET